MTIPHSNGVHNGEANGRRLEIAYYGLGGIGGLYAYIFGMNANVTVFARSNYDVVKNHGQLIRSHQYGEVVHRPHRVFHTDDIPKGADREYDYVICSAKAYIDLEPSNAQIVKPLVGPNTCIVLIQNGVGIEKGQGFVDMFPNNTILSCITYVYVCQELPGVVHHYTHDKFEVGYIDGQNVPEEIQLHQRDVLADLAKKGGQDVHTTDDIQSIRWRKQCLNVPVNGYCSIMRICIRDYWALVPESEHITRRIMKEVQAVATALGHVVPDSHLQGMVDYADTDRVGTKPSTMQDSVRLRPMEIETILGNPCRWGQELGVPVPTLEVAYALAKVVHTRNCVELGLKPKPLMYGGLLDAAGKEKKPWVYTHLNHGESRVLSKKGVVWTTDFESTRAENVQMN